MSTPRRSPRFALSSAVAAIAIAAICMLTREPAAIRVCHLSDGSVLKLEAVSYGRQHRFVAGPEWQRLLTPLLPASLRGLIALTPPIESRSDSDTLMLFVSRTGPPWPPGSALRAVVVDEHGQELNLGTPPEPGWPSGEVRSWFTAVFPRRAKQFGLRFYRPGRNGMSSPVAEFSLSNPAFGPYPRWKPNPMPATRRDGDLALTVAALATGLRDKGPVAPPWSRGDGVWTCAAVRLAPKGAPPGGWRISWVSLFDATGNRLDPIGPPPSPADGVVQAIFLGSLPRDEVAWKVRIAYARTAGFTPADLWVVNSLPAAAPGVVTPSGATVIRHGVTLRLLGMFGAHTPRSEGSFSYVTPGDAPSLQVEAVSPGDALQMGKGLQLTLLRASDDRGRRIPGALTSVSSTGRHDFELKPAANAKLVNLTFAVVKDRVAGFIVKPSWQ